MRFAAALAYAGGAYSGWQKQPHAPSVQACVERALSQLANAPVEVVAAGRTDAGVHACGQVIHFDTQAQRPLDGWLFGTNTLLPDDISMAWVHPVDASFHARYSARSRRYRYLIHAAKSRNALWHQRAAWTRRMLDVPAMHAAAQLLLGERDFSAFRAAECQSRTPWRNLQKVRVEQLGENIAVDIQANAFLHHMVRNIVGSLMEVGSARRSGAWLAEVLTAGQRSLAGPTAPACGLYFLDVAYPPQFGLPQPPACGPW